MKLPEISIVTVNYNGIDDTLRMIESVASKCLQSYEIIVVDNGSVVDETIPIKEKYPYVKVIRSSQNLGFAGGNNMGYKYSAGEYILFLNNDTILKDDSLQFLIETLKSNPQIGGVSPKILYNNGPNIIQYAGYTKLSSITIRNRTIGINEWDVSQYDKTATTAYLHGAAMMVKREVIEKVGLMPECYFLYYEEMDWSTQIRNAGFDLVYEPRTRVYHNESSSTGKESPLKIYYMTRNRLLYAWRNRVGHKRIISIVYLLLIAANKNIVKFALSMRFNLLNATLRGCIDFFKLQMRKTEVYD
jgi:GT2 family glycosyltransferase